MHVSKFTKLHLGGRCTEDQQPSLGLTHLGDSCGFTALNWTNGTGATIIRSRGGNHKSDEGSGNKCKLELHDEE